MGTYRGTARWSKPWWVIEIKGLPEGKIGVTQGRTRKEAQLMAVDVVALLLDVTPESVTVELTFIEEE